jgi:hypothetical protein
LVPSKLQLLVKFGVTKRGRVANRALALERAHCGWWPFAYTLLADLEDAFTADDEALLERVYCSMRVGNHVQKITRRNRFAALDEWLLDDLDHRFGHWRSIAIHDMAASNGITSLELFMRLARRGNVTVHCSDLHDTIYVVAPNGSRWKTIFDLDGRPLQYVGCGFVLSGCKAEPLRYPVNRVVQVWAKSCLLQRAATLLKAASFRQDQHAVQLSGGMVRRIRLVHPECDRLVRSEPRFTVGRDNLFSPRPRQFDIVRIMNALTPQHFEVERVLDGISRCAANVVEGGMFIVGRSVDEENGHLRATAFVRRQSSLIPCRDFGEGYELKGLATDIKLRAA